MKLLSVLHAETLSSYKYAFIDRLKRQLQIELLKFDCLTS